MSGRGLREAAFQVMQSITQGPDWPLAPVNHLMGRNWTGSKKGGIWNHCMGDVKTDKLIKYSAYN
jgi:hypothetical protein